MCGWPLSFLGDCPWARKWGSPLQPMCRLERTVLILRGGVRVKAELRRRSLFGAVFRQADAAVPPRLPDGLRGTTLKQKGEDGQDDVRTLWVDFDEDVDRFKRWRDVCKECYAPNFPVFDEKPIGPLTLLHFIKHAERHGGDVPQWMQLWCRAKQNEPTDRVYREMRVLCDSLHFAGTHDQVNIPALMSMEILCRRVQSVVQAIRTARAGSMPRCSRARARRRTLSVFRTYSVKRNKAELELLQARQKVLTGILWML